MTLPSKLDAAIHEAIGILEKSLRCTTKGAKSHSVLIVDGWADAPVLIHAVAVYLVGLLASAVSSALHVRAQVENTEADRLELTKNVQALMGSPTAPLSAEKKQDERNPWIAEGLWHLCLFLAARRIDLHPPGRIIALDLPHIAAKDHGFDVVAIFRAQDAFGVSFVESKAYANHPNKAINDAVEFFREIDAGKHDVRVRQVVARMREAVLPNEQGLISSSLWKDTRAYLPNPHYDASNVMDWTNTRSSFQKLLVPADRIVVMPHVVQKFEQFFDDVGAAMFNFVDALKL